MSVSGVRSVHVSGCDVCVCVGGACEWCVCVWSACVGVKRV